MDIVWWYIVELLQHVRVFDGMGRKCISSGEYYQIIIPRISFELFFCWIFPFSSTKLSFFERFSFVIRYDAYRLFCVHNHGMNIQINRVLKGKSVKQILDKRKQWKRFDIAKCILRTFSHINIHMRNRRIQNWDAPTLTSMCLCCLHIEELWAPRLPHQMRMRILKKIDHWMVFGLFVFEFIMPLVVSFTSFPPNTDWIDYSSELICIISSCHSHPRHLDQTKIWHWTATGMIIDYDRRSMGYVVFLQLYINKMQLQPTKIWPKIINFPSSRFVSIAWKCWIDIGKSGHVARQYFPYVSSESDLQRYKAIPFRQNSTNNNNDQNGSSSLSNVPSDYKSDRMRVRSSHITNNTMHFSLIGLTWM